MSRRDHEARRDENEMAHFEDDPIMGIVAKERATRLSDIQRAICVKVGVPPEMARPFTKIVLPRQTLEELEHFIISVTKIAKGGQQGSRRFIKEISRIKGIPDCKL